MLSSKLNAFGPRAEYSSFESNYPFAGFKQIIIFSIYYVVEQTQLAVFRGVLFCLNSLLETSDGRLEYLRIC